MKELVAKVGLAIAATSIAAYITGPGPRNSLTLATPVQTGWGGGDALVSGAAGVVLWYLFR